MLQLGHCIDRRYEVLEKLGQGGMGAVYRVKHLGLERDYALKELCLSGADAEAQFRAEAKLLAGLSHPNLPGVIDYFGAKGGHYLVMEHVPGDDLQVLFDRQGAPFAPEAVLPWLKQLLAALAYVHARHVVHRDVKPANLKLTPDGRLVLVDFGIAKGGAQAPGRTAFQAKGAFTPYLAAPEQVLGQPTGPKTDLYGAAATFTYLLTGQLPPSAAALPAPLGTALARAMAPDPAGRFADAAAFAGALQGLATPGLTTRRDIRR